MATLESTIVTLDAGVSDLPRLSKVLHATRHFELVSEPDLVAAQSALMSEIEPEVQNLLTRVENFLDKLERREQSLIAKYELNLGRLHSDDTPRLTRPLKASLKSRAGTAEAIGPLEAMKVQQLRQKKERLSFAIERLQLQASQKQRELRKSMAAQPQILDEDF